MTAADTLEAHLQPEARPLTPWHCWRCVTWNLAIILCLAACGAYLGFVSPQGAGLAQKFRFIAKAIPVVIILGEILRSPAGIKATVIRAIYGAVYWLGYHGLDWITGGWQGGVVSTSIGALLGAVVGLGIVLIGWKLAPPVAAPATQATPLLTTASTGPS